MSQELLNHVKSALPSQFKRQVVSCYIQGREVIVVFQRSMSDQCFQDAANFLRPLTFAGGLYTRVAKETVNQAARRDITRRLTPEDDALVMDDLVIANGKIYVTINSSSGAERRRVEVLIREHGGYAGYLFEAVT